MGGSPSSLQFSYNFVIGLFYNVSYCRKLILLLTRCFMCSCVEMPAGDLPTFVFTSLHDMNLGLNTYTKRYSSTLKYDH